MTVALSACVDKSELETLCEWFGVVEDLNPAYLEKKDYVLACRLYVCAGRWVSNSMYKGVGIPLPKDRR